MTTLFWLASRFKCFLWSGLKERDKDKQKRPLERCQVWVHFSVSEEQEAMFPPEPVGVAPRKHWHFHHCSCWHWLEDTLVLPGTKSVFLRLISNSWLFRGKYTMKAHASLCKMKNWIFFQTSHNIFSMGQVKTMISSWITWSVFFLSFKYKKWGGDECFDMQLELFEEICRASRFLLRVWIKISCGHEVKATVLIDLKQNKYYFFIRQNIFSQKRTEDLCLCILKYNNKFSFLRKAPIYQTWHLMIQNS